MRRDRWGAYGSNAPWWRILLAVIAGLWLDFRCRMSGPYYWSRTCWCCDQYPCPQWGRRRFLWPRPFVTRE